MIPFSTITLSADGGWYFTWASGHGTVDLVLWGQVIETTSGTEYTHDGAYSDPNTPPPLEVIPTGTVSEGAYNIPHMVLQWYRVECNYYDIERWAGSEWVSEGTILDDPLITTQTFITPSHTHGRR